MILENQNLLQSKTINHVLQATIIPTDPKYNFQPKIFRGEYCIRYFLDELQKDYLKLKDTIEHPLKMSITTEQYREYDHATTCSFRHKAIDSTHIKVADLCNLTSEFRGAAIQAPYIFP